MEKPLTIGVVGCGYWGPNLIRNFRSLPDCRVKFMCDLDPARLRHLRSLYPEVQGETDFDRLVEDPEIDAIAVATAVRSHFPLARKCLEAGKHAFVEKPLASSVEECEALLAFAERKGLVLMSGHTFLYAPAVTKIKEIVDSGEVGDIRYVSCRRLNLGLFQQDINVVWDLAPHDLSIVLRIMGEAPLRLNCQGASHVTEGVEDVASLNLAFSGQRSAVAQFSWLDPRKVREITIVGSKKMIVYDDVQPIEKIKIYDARVDAPPHYDTFGEFHYAYHYGDAYIPFIKQDEPLKTECRHFLGCIRRGQTPFTDGRAGLEVVRLLEAASDSLARGGAPVDLRPPAAAGA